MSRTCSHEAAVLTAARVSQATPVPEPVEAHLATCDDCRMLFAITLALQDERAAAIAAARVPSAGQVWWRAELRARQDAAAAVARPVTVAAGLAAAAVVGVLASLLGVIGWWMRAWIGGVVSRLAWPEAATHVTWSTSTWLFVAFALAAMALATPVVLYVASREE